MGLGLVVVPLVGVHIGVAGGRVVLVEGGVMVVGRVSGGVQRSVAGGKVKRRNICVGLQPCVNQSSQGLCTLHCLGDCGPWL